MIRIYRITAPLDTVDPDTATAIINSALGKLRLLYSALIEAQATADQGVLTLKVRVSARDQWACQRAARKIGANMLLRAKVPDDGRAEIELVGTAPPARTLTKERGRSSGKGRQPAVKPSEAL